jgi:hypothetical protein
LFGNFYSSGTFLVLSPEKVSIALLNAWKEAIPQELAAAG